MKTLIVIPTYNELHNIQKLIPLLLEKYPELDILIVDDNSPDGTADFVEQTSKIDKRVRVLKREKKMGLGTAYVAGFKYMLNNGYQAVIQMDADYSHDPAEIANFLEKIKNYDLVIGSRYIDGVRVINWPIRRLLLSYFANNQQMLINKMQVVYRTMSQ